MISDIISTVSQASPTPAPVVAAFATVSAALLEAIPVPAPPELLPALLVLELFVSLEIFSFAGLFALLAAPVVPESDEAFGFACWGLTADEVLFSLLFLVPKDIF